MKRKELYITPNEESFASDEETEDSNLKLAKNRTQLAMIRTVLANERSFSAWIRTGISSELIGLAVAKLLFDFQPEWIPVTVGFFSYLLVLGLLFMVDGAIRVE